MLQASNIDCSHMKREYIHVSFEKASAKLLESKRKKAMEARAFVPMSRMGHPASRARARRWSAPSLSIT